MMSLPLGRLLCLYYFHLYLLLLTCIHRETFTSEQKTELRRVRDQDLLGPANERTAEKAKVSYFFSFVLYD